MRHFIAVIALLAAGCSSVEPAPIAEASGAPPPPRETTLPTTTLRATLYHVAVESEYPSAKDAVFKTRSGDVIATVSTLFVDRARIEGSAKLADGRVVNVDGRVDGDVRWRVISQAFGLDAVGCGLVPFRSAAVDPKVIPLRTKIYIRETDGMKLPGSARHDGIWYAVDTGGAIEADRIDLFVGEGQAGMSIARSHGIGHLQALTITQRGPIIGCAPAN